MIVAFDADVLIYAAAPGHSIGGQVAELFDQPASGRTLLGSVLLMNEVLVKPMRQDPESPEVTRLLGFLARIDLLPFDRPTAVMAVTLAVKYGLKPMGAAHLATAIVAGADCFLTNNRNDFGTTITEIDVAYPADW